jgi:hypothetical protein
MEHKIFRHNNGENFTILSNEILQNTEMSFFTKGVFVYLLSLPQTWHISVAQVANKFEEKESRILKAFRELINFGYCVRKAHHENGRLCGQHYYISDTVGGLSELMSKPKENKAQERNLFEDLEVENSDTQESAVSEKNSQLKKQPTEKTAHSKNGGAYNKELLEDKKINKYSKEKKMLFCDNPILTEEFILERFSEKAYEQIDVLYYYHTVKDWSTSSNTKRTENGWLATIRNFMRSDKERGTLHLKPQYQQQSTNYSQMTDYLNL